MATRESSSLKREGAVLQVRVLEEVCQGHTLCNVACPSVFKLRDDDGHAYVLDENVPSEFEADVRRAAAGCPECAIVVDE